MSRLDELIQEKCSDGVKYKKLGDIAIKITDGMHNLPKGAGTDGAYPILSAQNINNGIIDINASKWVSPEVFEIENRRTNVQKGDVLLTIVGAIGRVAVVDTDLKALFQRSVCVIKLDNSVAISRYVFFALQSSSVQSYIQANAHGAAQKGIYLDNVSKIVVPLPPIEIQREIVRILDNFTNLTAELTAELTARQKQYEFYRDKLLTFDVLRGGTIDFSREILCRIADLGKWSGGKTPSMAEKKYWESGTIPWVSSKDVKQPILSDTIDHITNAAIDEASMTVYPAGSVAIVTRSGILRHTFPVTYIPFETTVNQDIKILVTKEGISSRYVSHALQAYGESIRRTTKKQGGTVDSLDFQKVLAYKIPVPPLDVQNRIVNVLDNFEKICSDLNIGLPAEIEARQKQYEYYRDKLLTFKEVAAT